MVAPLIVIAPDKFKSTVTADEAARAIADGISAGFPEAQILLAPMADGGEGTAEVLTSGRAEVEYVHRGEIQVPVYRVGSHAFINSADIVGMKLITGELPDPMYTSTSAVGEVISQIISRFDSITLCVGGTATVDAGAGMLQALGAKYFDPEGYILADINMAAINRVAKIDLSPIDILSLNRKIRLIVDVDVPLISDGPSSLTFAPQKGLQAKDLPNLKAALAKYLQLLIEAFSQLGYTCTGAPKGAGGGIEAFFNMIGCERALGSTIMSQRVFEAIGERRPAIIITGEGSFDPQSLTGKITGTLIAEANRHHIPAIIIAGRVDPSMLKTYNSQIHPLTSPTSGIPSPAETKRLLTAMTTEIAKNLREEYISAG